MIARLRRRLAEVRSERDRYREGAERQLAAFEGAIQALEGLLEEEEAGDGAPEEALPAGPA